jgi:hypothetical protein
VAVIVGLVFSFREGRAAIQAVIGTSAAAVAMIFLATSGMTSSAVARAAAAKQGGAGPDKTMAAAMIRVDWQLGFWITMLALIAAGVLAWMALAGKTFAGIVDAMPETKIDKDPPTAP